MIVKIGTEAAQYLFWEHINGIFLAVRDKGTSSESAGKKNVALWEEDIKFKARRPK